MSTKPNIIESRFAVDGANADAANFLAPSSGQRDTGWNLDQAPPSSVANYLQNKAYRWFQFLDAVFTAGGSAVVDLTIGGAFAASGAATIGGAIITGGALTVGGQGLVFVDFVYTANSGTDQLHGVAHGLATGDGPVRTSNTGGGLPAGLLAATDYYIIKVDADNVKVATSRVNAINGTAIDITTSGTGTQTLLHQVSTTRISDAEVTRNLVVDGLLTVSALAPTNKSLLKIDPGGVVFAANDVLIFPGTLAVLTGVASFTDAGAPIGTFGTSGSSCFLPLALPVGFKITAWSFSLQKNSASGTIIAELWKLSSTGVATQVGSTQTNGANNPGNISLGQSSLSTVVATGESFSIRFNGGTATGDFFFFASVTPG